MLTPDGDRKNSSVGSSSSGAKSGPSDVRGDRGSNDRYELAIEAAALAR